MADALLDDLDDLSDVDPEEEESNNVAEEIEGDGGNSAGQQADGDNETAADANNTANSKQSLRTNRLLHNNALKSHLQSVRSIKRNDETTKMSSSQHKNSKEEDEHEHQLILSSNKHLVSLRNEIHNTHLDICKSYHSKFPELEELITDPFQYRAAVGVIQNEMDVMHSNHTSNQSDPSNETTKQLKCQALSTKTPRKKMNTNINSSYPPINISYHSEMKYTILTWTFVNPIIPNFQSWKN